MQTLEGGEAAEATRPRAGVRTAWRAQAGRRLVAGALCAGGKGVCREGGANITQACRPRQGVGLVLSTDGKACRELSREVADSCFKEDRQPCGC